MPKKCMLEEDKICDNCCECGVCIIDKNKLCDNCARCVKKGLEKIIYFAESKHDIRLINRSRKIIYYKAR